MATTLTLTNLAKDAMLNALDTYVGVAGTLEFQTSGDVEVATLALTNPAFENASAGVMALDCDPDLQDTSATGGVMAKFVIKVAGATAAITGEVAVTGGAINFAGGLTVGVGDTVVLQTFSISM